MDKVNLSQDEALAVGPQQVWKQLSGDQQAKVLQIISQICQGLAEQQSPGKEAENDRDSEPSG